MKIHQIKITKNKKRESNKHTHDQSSIGRFGSKPQLAMQKGGSQTQITFHVKRSKPFRMKIQKNNHQLLNNNQQHRIQFKSTFCGQCRVRSHHIHPSISTFLGMYSKTTGYCLQSTQSTFAPVVPQSSP